MARRTSHKRFLPLVIAVLVGCGGPGGGGGEDDDDFDTTGGEEPVAQHRGNARELIGIHPPERPWSEMSHEDHEMDMIGRFLPIMNEYFQEHAAERFANFSCETCHGGDMRERNWHMPSNELPPMPLAGTPAYQRMTERHPADMRFMEEQVTPAMQTMLGMGATFTCNGCHPVPAAN